MSRSELIAELRRRADQLERPVQARDLPTSLWRALQGAFGSMDQARRAANVGGPAGPRRWTREAVIAEMRRVSRAGIAITRVALEDSGHGYLLGAISSRFASIGQARAAARVPEPAGEQPSELEEWDEERITAEINGLHRAGEPLAYSRAPRKLLAAGERYFGSWRAAVEAAGLAYDRLRLTRAPYGKRDLLVLLRRLARQQPRMTRNQLLERPFSDSLVRVFGSVDEALQSAALKGWPVRLHRKALRRGAVLAAIRARRRSGKPLGASLVKSDDHNLWYSAAIRFGDWQRALHAARVEDLAAARRWTRDLVLRALRSRRRRGLSLRTRDVQRDDPGLCDAARRYFGGYVAAAAEVGDTSWARRRWTPAVVIAELRRAAGGRGFLTYDAAGSSLADASARYFGTFSAACQAAGLGTGDSRPYRVGPPRIWSREKVLAELRRLHAEGVRMTARELVAAGHAGVVSAAVTYIGSFVKARAAAGLSRP